MKGLRPPGDFFRAEALAPAESGEEAGTLLRIAPGWAHWTAGLLLSLLVVTCGFLWFGRIGEYVTSAVIIQVDAGADTAIKFSLPSHQGTALRPGLSLRLELSAFPRAYHDLLVTGIEPAGEYIQISATAPAFGFIAGDRVHRYVDGMEGVIMIRTGSRRIFEVLRIHQTGRQATIDG